MWLSKRIYVGTIVLLAMIGVGAANGVAQAAVLTVTTTDDVIDPADGVLSLREAILDAAGGDIIEFDRHLAPATITLNLGPLVIEEKGLTIEGLGAKRLHIDGNGDTVFRVGGSAGAEIKVNLENVTISGGGLSVGGRAELTVTNCFVEYSIDDGVRLTSAGASTTLINTPVRHNNGRGLRAEPGGRFSLINSPVEYNAMAGAFLNGDFGGADLSLLNSNVQHNGGAGIVQLRSSSLSVNSSAVRGNAGRGILTWRVSGATLVNSVVAGNTEGGIYLFEGGNLTMRNSRIVNNTASVGAGILKERGSSINIRNSVIKRNHADVEGGGIFSDSTTGVSIVNTVIRRNTPDNCVPAEICP